MYETLFQNVRKNLSTVYQNKTEMPGKIRKCPVYLQKVASYIKYRQVNWL